MKFDTDLFLCYSFFIFQYNLRIRRYQVANKKAVEKIQLLIEEFGLREVCCALGQSLEKKELQLQNMDDCYKETQVMSLPISGHGIRSRVQGTLVEQFGIVTILDLKNAHFNFKGGILYLKREDGTEDRIWSYGTHSHQCILRALESKYGEEVYEKDFSHLRIY